MNNIEPRPDNRPWGNEIWFPSQDKPVMVKILTVNPGEMTSLQLHHFRDEYWYVIEGEGQAQVGTEQMHLSPGTYLFVSREKQHRLQGGKTTLRLLEFTFGQFSEDDIVRIEDKYGRS